MSVCRLCILLLGWFLLAPSVLQAVIMKLTPLKEVISAEDYIVFATVTRIEPDRPAMMLTVTESLKGKPPFEKIAVNLTGDSEAKKEAHSGKLLERMGVDSTVIIFSSKRGKRYSGFCFSEGTWFQILGTADADGTVRWSFLHAEPYLRRTFKGTTAELKTIVSQSLAGKSEPPVPDAKEPPGFGPILKPVPKEEKPSPQGHLGKGLTPIAVIPSFVVLAPLAILAGLFPAVFGGLALMMKRWMVLLSISSLVSTLYFVHGFFAGSFTGTWFGTPMGLWFTSAGVSLTGLIFAANRWWQARWAETEAMQSTRLDRLILVVASMLAIIAIVIFRAPGQSWLVFPWLEVAVFVIPIWIGTIYAVVQARTDVTVLIQSPMPGYSVEMICLLTLVGTCFGAAMLETGRSTSSAANAIIQGDSDNHYPARLEGVTWSYQPDEKGVLYSSPWMTSERTYLAIAGESGFTKTGRVIAIDSRSGKLAWEFDDEGGLKPLFSSPTLAEGLLLIGEGFHQDQACRLIALDAMTGAKKWEFTTGSHVEAKPAVANGLVYFGAGNDGVYAVDLRTGEKRWQYTGENGVHIDSNPAVAEGCVCIGTGYSRSFQLNSVVCLDAVTGKVRWQDRVDQSVYGTPLIDQGSLYVGIGNGNYSEDRMPISGGVLAYDLQTGTQKWRCDLPNSVLGQPAIAGDRLFVGCRDGRCYVISRLTGAKIDSIDIGSPVLASVVVSAPLPGTTQTVVYAAGHDGILVAIDAATAKILWKAELKGLLQVASVEVIATPVVNIETGPGGSFRRIGLGVAVSTGLASFPRMVALTETVPAGQP